MLFEELAKLYTFRKTPADYVRAVPVSDELSRFAKPGHKEMG